MHVNGIKIVGSNFYLTLKTPSGSIGSYKHFELYPERKPTQEGFQNVVNQKRSFFENLFV
jgi:hypothetical protein